MRSIGALAAVLAGVIGGLWMSSENRGLDLATHAGERSSDGSRGSDLRQAFAADHERSRRDNSTHGIEHGNPELEDSWPDFVPDPELEEFEGLPLHELLANLRDDDEPWNASHSATVLESLEGVTSALAVTLGSDDSQARLFAAEILRRRGEGKDDPRYWSALVEGTQKHRLDHLFSPESLPAWIDELCEHVERAETPLADALHAADEFQRYTAAYCLSHEPNGRYADRAVEILLPHLLDDDLEGNGTLAALAIQRYAKQVPGLLDACIGRVDAQGQRLLERVTPRRDDHLRFGKLYTAYSAVQLDGNRRAWRERYGQPLRPRSY